MRVAVGLLGVRPLMKSMIACDCGSTGAIEMSRFHQLLIGNTCRDVKSSRRTTLSATMASGPPGSRGDVGRVGVESCEHAAQSVSVDAMIAMRARGRRRMTGSLRPGCGQKYPSAYCRECSSHANGGWEAA